MAASMDLESSAVELTRGLGALAEPVRLAVVGVLAEGEHCVCQLHERVPVAANLLSYHLGVLRDAGLVVATRRGRWVDYRLDLDAFAAMWAAAAVAGIPTPGKAPLGSRPPTCLPEGVAR